MKKFKNFNTILKSKKINNNLYNKNYIYLYSKY